MRKTSIILTLTAGLGVLLLLAGCATQETAAPQNSSQPYTPEAAQSAAQVAPTQQTPATPLSGEEITQEASQMDQVANSVNPNDFNASSMQDIK